MTIDLSDLANVDPGYVQRAMDAIDKQERAHHDDHNEEFIEALYKTGYTAIKLPGRGGMPPYHIMFPPRTLAARPARHDRRGQAAAQSNLRPIQENTVAQCQTPTIHFTPIAQP